MDNSETKQNARDLFMAAWDDFMAEPVYELSVLKYHYRRCSKAFDLDPSLVSSLPVASKLMGLLNFGLGVCAAEEGLMEETKVYYEEAIKSLEKCDGLDWMSFWVLGKALREVGEIEKSVPAFQQAVELAVPGNACGPEPTNELLARLWDEFAGVYSSLERPNDAADCYEWATLYSTDSRFLQSALAVASWFARRYERVIAVSRWALCSDGGVVVPPLLLELLAAAAIRTNRLEVAVEAYEKLLAGCKNPEAREFYSRMLGYVEGHRDSCKGQLVWDAEGFAWTSWHDRYDSERKPESLDQLVDVLRKDFQSREELRDSVGRVSLQILEIKEGLARIRSAEEEREHVRETLEKEVSGDLWETMHDVTREALVNAGLWISRCVPTHDGDCSPAVAMYQKAVELEVSRRILEPFQRFLQEKGVREWQIGSSPRKTNAITSLDLNKVRDLLQDWQRILKPPKGQRNDDIHDLANAFHGVDGFLGEYSDGQKGLVDDLVQLLNWMPPIGRVAKHTDLVSYDRLMELRYRLIGSHPQPGLLIRLVQTFPTRT